LTNNSLLTEHNKSRDTVLYEDLKNSNSFTLDMKDGFSGITNYLNRISEFLNQSKTNYNLLNNNLADKLTVHSTLFKEFSNSTNLFNTKIVNSLKKLHDLSNKGFLLDSAKLEADINTAKKTTIVLNNLVTNVTGLSSSVEELLELVVFQETLSYTSILFSALSLVGLS
jgi:hypothetical protein